METGDEERDKLLDVDTILTLESSHRGADVMVMRRDCDCDRDEHRHYGNVKRTDPLKHCLLRWLDDSVLCEVKITDKGTGRSCKAQVIPPKEFEDRQRDLDLTKRQPDELGGVKPTFEGAPNWKRWQTVVEMAHLYTGRPNDAVWDMMLCAPVDPRGVPSNLSRPGDSTTVQMTDVHNLAH